MSGIRLAAALALFATLLTLASGGDSFAGATTLETYPNGFERRVFPRAWMCCTKLTSLDGIADSDLVLQAFANGENDQKQSITLSAASFTAAFTVGGGEYCRYAPDVSLDASPESVPTSTEVTMQKGTVMEYFAMQAEDSSAASLMATHQALKAAINEQGGAVKTLAFWKIIIVETTPDNHVYVGAPHRPI